MAAAIRALQRRRRTRELASERRAGSWSGGEARRLQYGFVKANWLRLTLALLIMIGLSPAVLFLPSWARGFAAGAWVATSVSCVFFWVVLASGSATRLMGRSGEQWTARDLRALEKRGWRLLNHVYVGPHELDHVVIGPRGLLVVESKWTGWKRVLPRDAEEYQAVVRRHTTRAAMLARTLRHITGSCPLYGAVVVWGPEVDTSEAEINVELGGTMVLAGDALGTWIAAVESGMNEDSLTPTQVQAAWEHLEREVDRSDQREQGRSDHPAPVMDLAAAVWWGVVGGFAGVIAVGMAWDHLKLPVALPVTAALIALGLLWRRTELLRTAALGWTAGVVGSLVIAGVLTAAVLLTGY